MEKVDVSVSTVFIPNAKFTEPIFPINKVHDVSFEGANKSIWPFLPGFTNLKTYITYKLGKTILEAREFYDKHLMRSDMFRACIMDEALKWAAIAEHDIGVARHPHFTNPRISPSQTRVIITDVVRIVRAARAQEKKRIQKLKEAEKKRNVATMRKKKADEDDEFILPKRRSRGDAARHAAWCKRMQAWGEVKRKRGF